MSQVEAIGPDHTLKGGCCGLSTVCHHGNGRTLPLQVSAQNCGLWPVSSEEGTGGLFSSSETSWDPSKADVLEGTPVEEWLAVLSQKQPTGRKAEEYRWGTDSLKNVVPTLGLRVLSTQVYNQ